MKLTSVPEPYRTGLVALLLAALVAAASQGGPVWTALREGGARRTALPDPIARPVALGVIAIVATAFLAQFVLSARRHSALPPRRPLRRALGVAAIVAVVALLLVSFIGDRERPALSGGGALELQWFSGVGLANDPEGSIPSLEVEYVQIEPDGAPPDTGIHSALLILLFAAFLALIVSTLLLMSYRRRIATGEEAEGAETVAEDSDPIEVRDVLAGSIDAMLRDPDPRTAIIGAYAHMLEALAERGLGRRDHEGPIEHLVRILSSAQVPARPLHQIVGLFELARFSSHALSDRHRQQALQSLRAAAAGLPAKSPSAVPAEHLSGSAGDR